jgi:rhamnosyltransferase subunit B
MKERTGRKAWHAIIPTIGTDGDVYPFVGLGTELLKRGYRVTIATHEHFAACAQAAGLGFVPLVSDMETNALVQQRDFWHHLKGPVVISRWGAKLMPRQYEVLSKLALGNGTFIVASPGVVAARIIQERSGIPLFSVILQPWMIPSIYAPPVMMGGLTLPRWAPKAAGKLYIRLLHEVGGFLVGEEVKRLRRSLGLRAIRRFFDWWYSPDLVLGMFPEWFGQPQADWPKQLQLAGFPLNESGPDAGISQRTLAFCRQGERPVAFTFGTGMMHAGELFRLGIAACKAVGARGIILTKYRNQLPQDLPSFMHHSSFEPFQKLFPRCAAVVHHGGVGTVARALAAGTPQLILPFAFDQLDNAVRVKRLGAGGYCDRRKQSVATLAQALDEAVKNRIVTGAKSAKRRFRDSSGLERAIDLIEERLK